MLDELGKADELDCPPELLLGTTPDELGKTDELDNPTELLLGTTPDELGGAEELELGKTAEELLAGQD
jgi:hypothetical protein